MVKFPTLYRYVEEYTAHGGLMEWGEWEYSHTTVSLKLIELSPFKETEKGFWVAYRGKRKWVPKSGRKRFAYPSEREAMDSFIARKKRQIKLLTEQIKMAESSLRIAGDYR